MGIQAKFTIYRWFSALDHRKFYWRR